MLSFGAALTETSGERVLKASLFVHLTDKSLDFRPRLGRDFQGHDLCETLLHAHCILQLPTTW